MKRIDVPLKENGYTICVGRDILSGLGAKLKSLHIGQDAVVITHPRIHKLYGKVLEAGLRKAGFSVKLLTVPEGEKNKSAQIAFRVIEQIARYDVYKRIFVVALGGGVIGDLAGYVAAAYKRGVPFVQVPTTFLAQVDSSIGGKVAVDLPVGKNLIGAFYQPRLVWSDVSVLRTLPRRQILNGLAEAVKYGIIKDKNLFDYIETQAEALLTLDPRVLEKVVLRCSDIKAKVVAKDEKETKGLRTVLNFGHTIGHALEAASEYGRYHHGEAVALGMRVAMDMAEAMKLCSSTSVARVNRLLTTLGLPEKIEGLKSKTILNVMKHDKKFISGKNRFVLAIRVGCVRVLEGIPLSVIEKSLQKFL